MTTKTVPPILNDSSEIVLVPIAELKQHPDNPREGNRAAIRESLEEHGFYGSVLVQRSSNTILVGWHRTDVYRELGADVVPVTYADVDDEQALALVGVDNRSGELGGFNSAKLLAMVEKLQDGARGLTGTGYTNDDLAGMIRASGRFGEAATGFLGGGEPEQQPDEPRDSGGDGTPRSKPRPEPEAEKVFSVVYAVNANQRELILAAIGQARMALGDSRDTPVTSSQALAEVCRSYARG
jgi:hypothetical protein